MNRPPPDHLQQLRDIQRALDHAAIVATTDVTGRITYVNDKFCEISGYSRDELIGRDHRIINSGHHPKTFIRELWRTIAHGRVWHGEFCNRAKAGHLYWVDTTIVPFLDDRGKPYQYVSIRHDISGRKMAEAALARQAALAQVGQLAAVVAHEVRNPLAGIKGALQVLMSRRPPGDADVAVMREIVARVDSLNELLNDLMLFARPRAPRLAATDLRAVVQDAVALARRDPAGEPVEFAIEGNEITATVDAEMIRATVLNLLLNAAQAMQGRGRVQVTLSQRDHLATLTVQDSGPGVPAEIRDKIFEPFFTTKSRGGGLGLPIARRTAELHGGSLSVECPPDGGTVMTLTVPVTPGLVQAAAMATPGQATVAPA